MSLFKSVAYVALNVSSSVTLVFINKSVFREGLSLVSTFTALHLFATALFGPTSRSRTLHVYETAPWTSCLQYALAFNVSVVASNLSLLHNGVGTYQLLKLTVIPIVSLMERFSFSTRMSTSQITALVMLILGGVLPVVEDKMNLGFSMKGLLAGMCASVACATQTVYLKFLHNKYGESDVNLLRRLAAWSCVTMVVSAPVLDVFLLSISFKQYTGTLYRLIGSYKSSFLVAVSAFVAVLVNASQLLIVGKFNALTFQVVGQVKNVCIILCARLLLHEEVGLIKGTGMLIGLGGAILYSKSSTSSTATRCYVSIFFLLLLAVCLGTSLLAFGNTFYERSMLIGSDPLNSPPELTVSSLTLRNDYNVGLLNVLKRVKFMIDPAYQQYLTDISVARTLHRSSFYTDDLNTATYIFVPFYSGLWTLLCLYSQALFTDQVALKQAFRREQTECPTLSDLLDDVMQSPSWTRSNGTNFIWISNHVDVRPVLHPTIFMTVENTRDRGADQLSLVLPYSIIEPVDLRNDGERFFNPSESRKFHMVFQGELDRSPKRLQMYNATRAWRDRYRFNHPETPRRHVEYMRTLTQFDFCFVPDGHVRTTVRLFEALVAGCIPVVWSPGIELPFTYALDYHAILLLFDAHATPETILQAVNSMSMSAIKRMRKNIYDIHPNTFFSQSDPLSNKPISSQETGDKVWQEFAQAIYSKA